MTFSDRNSLTVSDQFISGNLSMSCFNSSGMDNVIFGILIPPAHPVQTVYYAAFYKSFDSSPKITNAYTDPTDVKPKDKMLVSAV